MSDEVKRRWRWFWAWQDEQEEAWLGEMARSGWHLRSVAFPNRYEFDRGVPRDVAYRLDFHSGSKDMAEYLRLFADAGWEHVGQYGGWQYFRVEAHPGEAPQIFSDNATKAAKYRRVIGLLVALLPMVLFWTTRLGVAGGPLGFAYGLAGLLFLLVYSYALIQLIRRVGELQRWSG